MARSEARLAVTIWSDPDFVALSATAQRMFMFLLSQPDLAHDGVIALRERRWSKAAAGLSPAQVSDDLAELEQARFVVMDDDTEELLVRSFIRRDKVYRQPNVLRSAADHLGVVSSARILAEVSEELRRVAVAEDIAEGSVEIVNAMIAAARRGSENPSPNPSENPTPGTPGERGVVTVVSSASPSPVPRSPTPRSSRAASGGAPRASARSTRGTRIPDDFTVTPEMVIWARENTPDVDGRYETAKFVDYWRAKSGKDATKVDWPGTWRNWMRKAGERAGPPVRATTDDRIAHALDLGRRMQAEHDAHNGPKELGA